MREKTGSRIKVFVDNLEEIICALILVSIVCSLFGGVIFRYIIQNPFIWTDEYSRLALIWLTFLGIVVGVKHSSHIRVDFLERHLPPIGKTVIYIAINLAFIGFSLLMIINGSFLVKLKFGISTKALGWPWAFFYLPLVVSGFLLILRAIQNLYGTFVALKGIAPKGVLPDLD